MSTISFVIGGIIAGLLAILGAIADVPLIACSAAFLSGLCFSVAWEEGKYKGMFK